MITHPVHTALHRPLTVFGVELRLVAFAVSAALIAYNLTASALAGLVVALVGYGVAAVLTAIDPQMPAILWRHRPDALGGTSRRSYDAARRDRC